MTATYIGSGTASSDELAEALGDEATLTAPPTPRPDPPASWGWAGARQELLETWRSDVTSLQPAPGIVVCAWPEATEAVPLAELDEGAWRELVEWPTALWFTTVVAAADRCADGGSLVVVLERPATLDAPGRAPAVAVADGLVNLVRSLAATHGPRGVRVNAVTSQLQTVAGPLPGAPPPLATFPGRVDAEVAGAVRLLLADDAIGLTGTALHAGCGR